MEQPMGNLFLLPDWTKREPSESALYLKGASRPFTEGKHQAPVEEEERK
jgi:hypothetical protein